MARKKKNSFLFCFLFNNQDGEVRVTITIQVRLQVIWTDVRTELEFAIQTFTSKGIDYPGGMALGKAMGGY